MGYAIHSMLEDSIDSKPPSLIHQLRSGARFSMLWMPIRTGRGAGEWVKIQRRDCRFGVVPAVHWMQVNQLKRSSPKIAVKKTDARMVSSAKQRWRPSKRHFALALALPLDVVSCAQRSFESCFGRAKFSSMAQQHTCSPRLLRRSYFGGQFPFL